MKWYSFIPTITYFSAIIIVIAEKYLPYKKEWQKNKGDAGTDFIQTFIVLPIVSKISENLLPILLFFPILWVRDKISITL